MKKAQQANFPEFEAEMLKVWDKEQTFEQSLKQREGAPRFSFYDGPPFANGLPHFGHSLVTSIKDSLGRYHTMKGEYVERRNGWDCHGLPVEFAIEKQLGVSGKKQILELGLDKFNEACRDSVFMYKGDWEEFFRRIGRWTDTAHSYQSIDRDYTESVWWVLSQVHAQKLLYKGYKSMPYCPRCETPLSNFEVNEGYQDNVPDPSLFVKFRLAGEPTVPELAGASLLGWTTTPWSLPGNAAIAVNPAEQYVYVELTDADSGEREVLVLAKKRLAAVLKDESTYRVLHEVAGTELVGLHYEPLFALDQFKDGAPETMYRVWPAEFVSIDDGTGVLHVAPAFGEDDLSLGLEHGIEVLSTVDAGGRLVDGIGLDEVKGVFFKEADRLIVAHLSEQGAVFAALSFEHTYPFCYRCESPLLYYAISTWFVKVSAIREQMLKTAEQIEWTPGHIKGGRFGKWLEGARDWAISRNRYWGAPMPIWVNTADADDYLVVGSLDELAELAGLKDKPEDLHRPGIDAVVIEKDGKTYKRVEEVFDCWFESGSMPVAQQHYPFENERVFDESFPADYIGEGLDQTRLWFYVQHVISTILFDRPAYKHVLVNGMIMASDGQKLSKRLKNYPPVAEVFGTEGADTLRLYLLGNDQALSADYMRFNRDAMQDIQRNVFMTIWNSYSFMSMYAEIDGWEPPRQLAEPESDNLLDQWLVSRLNETLMEVTARADAFEIAKAIRPLRELVGDLSNWYVRRSRRRFWKSDDDGDKQAAYVTLHYVLCRISQMMAPWAPFVSDKLWRELTAGMDEAASVHLSDWPEVGRVDTELLAQMAQVRELVNQGLAARAASGIKVRQPLAKFTVFGEMKLPQQLAEVIAEEVNVKQLEQVSVEAPDVHGMPLDGEKLPVLDTEITPELKAEGMMRDVVRHVQNARKQTGLVVDDRIHLELRTESAELVEAIRAHEATIKAETLATKLTVGEGEMDVVPVKVSGAKLFVGVAKA